MKRRAKLNSKNFRVSKTQVYIAKATPVKPAPRPEMVETIRKIWNKQSPKFLKHIKKLSIQRTTTTGHFLAGYFDAIKDQLKFYDSQGANMEQYETTVVHELAHAKWWFMYRYHRDELKKFCERVSVLPPLNQYQRNHENRWRKHVCNQLILDNEDQKWANSYTNEMHSFLAEYTHNPALLGEYHEPITTQHILEVAVEAYEELHQINKVRSVE